MNALLTAIHTLLSTDGTLIAKLSKFRGIPAVFTGADVPAAAITPYVWITVVADEPSDTKNSVGRELLIDVQVWFPDTASVKDLNVAAERIRTLLHRAPLTITGYTNIIASCSLTPLAPDNGEIGRNIELRSILTEA